MTFFFRDPLKKKKSVAPKAAASAEKPVSSAVASEAGRFQKDCNAASSKALLIWKPPAPLQTAAAACELKEEMVGPISPRTRSSVMRRRQFCECLG